VRSDRLAGRAGPLDLARLVAREPAADEPERRERDRGGATSRLKTPARSDPVTAATLPERDAEEGIEDGERRAGERAELRVVEPEVLLDLLGQDRQDLTIDEAQRETSVMTPSAYQA
jgi:hypothetical protein